MTLDLQKHIQSITGNICNTLDRPLGVNPTPQKQEIAEYLENY
jgi:hypothetical protein